VLGSLFVHDWIYRRSALQGLVDTGPADGAVLDIFDDSAAHGFLEDYQFLALPPGGMPGVSCVLGLASELPPLSDKSYSMYGQAV
jgi:hypothetical protein